MKRIYSALVFVVCMLFALCLGSCNMFSKSTKTDTQTNTITIETNTNTNTEEIEEACSHSYVVHQGYAATCTKSGITDCYECTICGEKSEQYEILPTSHDLVRVDEREPTCVSVGWDTYHYCSRCDYTSYEELPLVSHSFENGNCSVCGETERYTRNGDTIYLGSYPQRLVTNDDLKTILNELAGALPTSDNPQDWTDYGYKSTTDDSFMWYIDVKIADRQYRGVYFTEKRTNDVEYEENVVYWFKYEPIPWTILEIGENNEAIIICNLSIDNQPKQTKVDRYSYDGDDFYVPEEGDFSGGITLPGLGPYGYIVGTDIYYGNYMYSEIRAWLNNDFYNTAFSELQKEVILTTEVDNSSEQETPGFEHSNTYDKIFLLSRTEYEYYCSVTDNLGLKPATDYAFVQGAYIGMGDSEGNEYTAWWLRSEAYYDAVGGSGAFVPGEPQPKRLLCIVPVITIQLYN